MTVWTKEELKMLSDMKESMDVEDMAILLPNKNTSEIKSKLKNVTNPVGESTISNSPNSYYMAILEWVGNETKPFSVIDFIKDNQGLSDDLGNISKAFQELEETQVIFKADCNPNKYATDKIVQNRLLQFLKKNRGQYFTTGPIYNNSGRYVPYMRMISILDDLVDKGLISKGIIKTNSIGYRFGKETAILPKSEPQHVVCENITVSESPSKRTFMQRVKRLIHYLTK